MRDRVLGGETVFGLFIFSNTPLSVEVAARTGLDWVLIDLEHGTADESDLLPMLLAAKGTEATPLVRVEAGGRIRVGRALDLGAQGVMVPQVHGADDARAVARWMQTQPSGDRGIALFTRGMDYGSGGHDAVASRRDQLLSIVQVESQQAVDECAEMADIDGIDVLFVGPTDLSHALGVPGQIDHPQFDAAARKVADAARSAGKAAGVLAWKPEDVGRYAQMGYTFFALYSDAALLDRVVRTSLDGARRAAAATTREDT